MTADANSTYAEIRNEHLSGEVTGLKHQIAQLIQLIQAGGLRFPAGAPAASDPSTSTAPTAAPPTTASAPTTPGRTRSSRGRTTGTARGRATSQRRLVASEDPDFDPNSEEQQEESDNDDVPADDTDSFHSAQTNSRLLPTQGTDTCFVQQFMLELNSKPVDMVQFNSAL